MTVIQLEYTIKHFEDGTICLKGTKNATGKGEAVKDENFHTIYITNNGNEVLQPIHPGFSVQNVTSLQITHCNLPYLPNELDFCNLIELDLSFNSLKQVPNFLILKNKNLQRMDLSHNILTDFDSEPKCYKKLQYLNLNSNCLCDMPEWIFDSPCSSLETLDISNNPFERIPLRLSGIKLIKLQTLELSNSNLKRVNFIQDLPNLVKLSIGNIIEDNSNLIQDVPFKQFKSAATITQLNLSRIGYSHLSEDITELSSLEILNFTNNHLSWLPSNFSDLKSLKILNLTKNELLCLPSDIGELKNLEELHLPYNLIGSLPESLLNLEKLKILDVYSNDLIDDALLIVNRIPSLIAFDIEQNTFLTNDEESYLKLRNNMRNMKEERLVGCKYLDFSDDAKSFSSVDTRYDSDVGEQVLIDYSHHEEENWDHVDIDGIYDDSMLVLPPFKLKCVKRAPIYNPSDYINPIYFEDALEDDT